jgi:hypothetical protein
VVFYKKSGARGNKGVGETRRIGAELIVLYCIALHWKPRNTWPLNRSLATTVGGGLLPLPENRPLVILTSTPKSLITSDTLEHVCMPTVDQIADNA